MCVISGWFAGHYSTRNFTHQHKMPKLFPTWSRHSMETGELLRSSVDLIHCDCYTNGINKGKITILKVNFHPLHSANLVAFLFVHKSPPWVCMYEHFCVPHHGKVIRSSRFSRHGARCQYIATFCKVKKQQVPFAVFVYFSSSQNKLI